MQIRSKNKGFTLIELLVVIAIIGLLAAIVLVSLNTARKKSRDARTVGDLHQISTAMEMYYDSSSAYLQTNKTAPGGTDAIPGGQTIGSFMTSVPQGNGSETYFWYNPGGDLQRYCVYASSAVTANPTGPLFYAGEKGTGTTTISIGCP